MDKQGCNLTLVAEAYEAVILAKKKFACQWANQY